ncbi:MAG: DUF362 domain-containing protein [Candidatus Coatesbacteria bacterium]|nr:DUF362 domain-containing protein [Candidatus Coatesbacteria bacterium]
MLYIARADYSEVRSAIEAGLESCGFDPGSKRILIKPNIVNAHAPEVGATTHPALIEALIDHFGGDRCIIAESCVVGVDTDETFRKSGLLELASKHGAELLNLQKVSRAPVNWAFGEIQLPTMLRDCAYINLAKMKTHILTGATLCLKNQKGMLINSDKMRFHRLGLDKAIPALYDVLKPDLAIIDAIWALEGEGPGKFGERKDLGLLLFGNDALELDNLAIQIMGLETDEVRHVLPVPLSEIHGVPLEDVRTEFKRSKGYYKKVNMFYFPCGACSGCSNAISETVKGLLKEPWRHPLKVAKFILNGIIGKRIFLAGIEAAYPHVKGRTICIGDCSKRFADREKLPHVKGCPPKARDILRNL